MFSFVSKKCPQRASKTGRLFAQTAAEHLLEKSVVFPRPQQDQQVFKAKFRQVFSGKVFVPKIWRNRLIVVKTSEKKAPDTEKIVLLPTAAHLFFRYSFAERGKPGENSREGEAFPILP